MTTSPLVTVIVLNWNSTAYLLECYKSLVAQVGCSWHLIVVDNGSTEPRTSDTFKRLEKEGTKVIRNEMNLGVARARNQGLSHVLTPYAMILDVDTQLRPDTLSKMIRFLEEHQRCAILGPRLVYPDGTLQLSCRMFPSVLGKLGRRIHLPWLKNIADTESLAHWDHSSSATVDYVIGAAQLIRMSAYDQVGPLDENMFYGPEDVDFCLRCWRSGWEVFYFPNAEVVHHEQRITTGFRFFTSKTGRAHISALLYFYRKHGGYTGRQAYMKELQKHQH